MTKVLVIAGVDDESLDLIDVIFPHIDEKMNTLNAQLVDVQRRLSEDTANDKDLQTQACNLIGELYELDGHKEYVCEDLRKYGQVYPNLYTNYALPNKKLKPEEREIMCFDVEITYTERVGYFGNTDVDCEINVALLDVLEFLEKNECDISEDDLELVRKQKKNEV